MFAARRFLPMLTQQQPRAFRLMPVRGFLTEQVPVIPQTPMLFAHDTLECDAAVMGTWECKKNKTSKQAERKRKKRKTGAHISIRFK